MVTITLPDGYGLVLGAVVSTFFVGSFLGNRVGYFRKAAKLPYPYEYASYEQVQSAPEAKSKALHQFNCAQRGHQNFNENHLTAVGSMLIAGLRYPKVAAVAGFVWSVNRVVYAIGYNGAKEGGKGRYYGILWMLAHYVLLGYATKTAYDVTVA